MATTSHAANDVPSDGHSANNERSFRPDIEGLRAIAVVLVVLNHVGGRLVPGGYVGVDIFFVLSGFLITGILFREMERTGHLSLRQFYARRARRLLPAGVLVLLTTVLAANLVIGGARAERVATDARWTSLFLANVRFIRQGTDYLNSTLPPSPLQHFWSLAVEEQFYVAWPLILIGTMVLARGRHLRAWCLGALAVIVGASLTWSIVQTASNGTAAYFSPLTRAWELGLGGMLALALPWIRRWPLRLAEPAAWTGLAAIAFAAMTYGPATFFPGSAALIPVLGTCLVVLAGAVRGGTRVERILTAPPFQIVGRWSYSIYLWHWPILVLAAAWLGRDLSIAEGLVLALGSVGLAGLTFALVERPVRDAPRLRRARPAVSIGLGAALTACVLVVSAAILATAPGEPVLREDLAQTIELPSEQTVLAAVAAGVDQQDWPAQPPRISNPANHGKCNVTRAQTTSALCVHGDPNGAKVAVIYGDSHGAMWVPALDLIGKEQGWQIVQLTKPGCQAPDFRRYSPTMKREYTECAAFREWAMTQIEELRPDLVLISSSSRDVEQWTDSGPSKEAMETVWGDGLATVLNRVSPVADRVVVIGDMPYPSEPGIDCLSAHPKEVGACNTDVADAVPAAMNAVEQRVSVANGATWVDVTPWFCTETVCPAVIGGLTVHRDSFHVNENYAVWLANVLGQAIGMVHGDRPLTAVHIPRSLTT